MLNLVGAIGDVHAEDETLELVLTWLSDERVTKVVCVGDVVDGPGDVARCCELLTEHDVECVRGNHDRWALKGEMRGLPDASPLLSSDTTSFLRALPSIRTYSTSSGQLLLCHGLGEDDMKRLGPDDYGYAVETNDALQDLVRGGTYRYVVNGHTHRRMVKAFGGVTVVNIGTLRRDHEPCFATIDFEHGRVRFLDVRVGKVHESEVLPLW